MTDESLVIILPLPVKVLQPNCSPATRGMMFAKAAAVKRYRRLACEAIREEDAGPWERVRVRATFHHKVNRNRDQDNAMGSLKSAYDGIVDAGLVKDDTPDYMERTIPEFAIDKLHPRVELLLERIE